MTELNFQYFKSSVEESGKLTGHFLLQSLEAGQGLTIGNALRRVLLSNLEGLKLILFILLLSCVASDIGGYILGKIFKGPKITKISPKKTYAGAVGSFLFTLIIMYLFSFYFIDLQIYKIIFISFMTSLFCQLGDLFFSLLKRKAKLKDTGKILPGHGGVIDRLDGIFLGIPVGFVSLTLLY